MSDLAGVLAVPAAAFAFCAVFGARAARLDGNWPAVAVLAAAAALYGAAAYLIHRGERGTS